LADKIFATATMIMLVEFGYMAGWMAVIILSREFMVTGLRMMAIKHNRVISADRWGKWKTALQMAAVFTAGLSWIKMFDLRDIVFGNIHLWYLWQGMLYVVVTMTIFSGIRYFYNNRDIILMKH